MVKKGEMLAVMGPSGAGKSTLLNALAGHATLSDGQVLIDNAPATKNLRRNVAYVLQQDVFFPNLTLKDTLSFYAMLKLPEKISKEMKIQRVEEILEILELKKCANTVIGDVSIHGLSGGERKRASIALELLTNPMILLLDEPTTGLDATIAYHLMQNMFKYAENIRKTVVVTMHQPSSRIFHLFHNLLLLSDGKVAYFGQGNKVVDYLSVLGLHCSPYYNPADFVLDKISEDNDVLHRILEHCRKCRSTEWPQELQKPHSKLNCVFKTETEDYVNKGYEDDSQDFSNNDAKNDDGFKLQNSIPESIMDTDVHIDSHINRQSKWHTGFCTQFTTLFQRNFQQASCRIFSTTSNVDLFLHILLIGVAWFRIGHDENSIHNYMGAITCFLMRWGFMFVYNGILAVSLHKDVINRERSAGIYRLSAYYCAVLASDMLLTCLQPVIFYGIIYWAIGQALDPVAFFSSVLIFVMYGISVQETSLEQTSLFGWIG